MKLFRFLFVLFLTLFLIYVLNNRIADIPFLKKVKSIEKLPALGKFLNPFEGFWVNAEGKKFPLELQNSLKGLRKEVTVVFDDRLIPHIFAQNEYDLYFAQGYVLAKFRLWQMEFLTHAAAGRVAEILGPDAVEYDRFQRRMGMGFASENALKAMDKDSTAKMIVEAYTAGVNARIAELQPKDYPLEYKLLGYAPEKWTSLKCALLLKYMAYDLSGLIRSDEFELTNILRKYGKSVVDELFPNYPKRHDPIIPPGTKWDFKSLPVPKKPEMYSYLKTEDKKQSEIKEEKKENKEKKEVKEEKKQGIGSNNWAIGADKSATKNPILSNDPHLSLNLPSIWFEMQLSTPELNVYGVTLPGAPGIVIGFNEKIAWGVTNVESDVLDLYQIQFRDNSLTGYIHNDSVKKISLRIEEIKIRGQKSIRDTVFYTHHGPILAKPGEEKLAREKHIQTGVAMRWLAHDPSAELMAFYHLNRAKNYDDYRQALTFYTCPAQNFIFADVNKDIAITPNGKFPLKWKEQGKYILDGGNAQHDWQGWVPYAQNPHSKNPKRGYVSSANQFSADTTYPYYLHYEFATYERGKRINERLEKIERATIDTLRALQNDNYSLRAKDLLPVMLTYVKADSLKEKYQKAYKELNRWNYQYEAQKISPSIFQLWWNLLSRAVWEDEFGGGEMRFPASDRTGDFILLNDSLPPRWFDNVKTPQKETLEMLLNQTFVKTIDSLEKKSGPMGKKWQWGLQKATKIEHLARIAAFSADSLLTNGGAGHIVNATGPRNGPSWRMVVEMASPQPIGYGIYPGGQSGNPGSHYYMNFIETWRKGELAPLLFMKNALEKNPRLISTMRLKKG